jgi:hypothetical protein
MQFTGRIEIGDWSGDVHGLSETFSYRATHSQQDVIIAYLARVQEIGLALHRQNVWNPPDPPIPAVLDGYGEDSLSASAQKKFTLAGVDMSKVEGDSDKDGSFSPTAQGVATLFLEIVKTKLKGFDYVFFEDHPLNVRHQLFSTFIGAGIFRPEDMG